MVRSKRSSEFAFIDRTSHHNLFLKQIEQVKRKQNIICVVVVVKMLIFRWKIILENENVILRQTCCKNDDMPVRPRTKCARRLGCSVQHSTVKNSTVQHRTARYTTVQKSTVEYSCSGCSAAQYDDYREYRMSTVTIVQYNTMHTTKKNTQV